MSVYQRNGHWHLSITINGRRIRRAIKEAQTKRQAEWAERTLRNEIYENRYGLGGQKLFAEFVETSYKPHAKEYKKGYGVECSVLNVLLDRFGKCRLAEIRPEEIEIFKRQRSAEVTSRGQRRSKATVNRDVAVLSAVFNLAKEYGELRENPVSHVRYYGNLPSRERVLSEEEEQHLFAQLGSNEDLARKVEILLYTGLRRGELFKLEWRDVDLDGGFLELRREITKTGRRRIVPMLSNVHELFSDIRRETNPLQSTERVFPGAATAPGRFTSRLTRICNATGLAGVTVHTLRHTFSTRADKYNVGAFAQRDILGHAKLQMTSKYTHPSKETLRASLVDFEQYVASR